MFVLLEQALITIVVCLFTTVHRLMTEDVCGDADIFRGPAEPKQSDCR